MFSVKISIGSGSIGRLVKLWCDEQGILCKINNNTKSTR